MTTATKTSLLSEARTYLGFTAGPNGDTPFGTWYGFPGQPWCDMFVSYCAEKAFGVNNIVGKFAYTPYHVAWFKAKNQWFTSNPQVGDIVFYDWENNNEVDHVGIVETVYSDGGIVVIEGNVDNQVMRVLRRTHIAGYGRPAYDAVPSSPPVNPPAPPVNPPVHIDYRQGHRVYRSKMHAGQTDSDSVWNVALALKSQGFYTGAMTEIYTEGLREACQRYQESQGWRGSDADGFPGPVTASRLGLTWVHDT